ncbi:MAG: hypothetical protein ACRD0H_20490, partial [Actinomycetes bacterium]
AAVLLVVNLRTVAQTQTAGRVTSPTASGQTPVTAPPPAGKQPPAGATPPSDDPSAPPSAAEGEQPAYAGRTSGNEATIAIVMRGDEASAYICDGKQVESWLEGTITDGALTLQGSDNSRADGSVQGDAMFGTLWVQGKQWPYAAQRAERPAGLYQGEGTVEGAPSRIGWIVLPDGSQVGIANIGGVPRPAPVLDPYQLSRVEIGGSMIVPRPVDGADNVANPPF